MDNSDNNLNRKILYWCTIGLAALTGLSFIVYSQFQTFSKIDQRRLKEQLKLSNAQLTEEYQQTSRNYYHTIKLFSASEVYQSVETGARDAQMTVCHFAISQPVSESNKVTVDLALDGDYQNFTRFLMNLQRETGFFEILNCNMVPSQLRKTTVGITLQLRFKLDGGVR